MREELKDKIGACRVADEVKIARLNPRSENVVHSYTELS